MPKEKLGPMVEIDYETADRIVVCSIRDSVKLLKEHITSLKRKKKLEAYEKKELAENIVDLDALEKVYEYYGGDYQ